MINPVETAIEQLKETQKIAARALQDQQRGNDANYRKEVQNVQTRLNQYKEDLKKPSEKGEQSLLELIESRIDQYQNEVDQLCKKREDGKKGIEVVQEQIRDGISDEKLREEVCTKVYASMETCYQEKVAMLNKLKELLVRVELVEEETAWEAYQLREIGKLHNEVKALTNQATNLRNATDALKDTMRTNYRKNKDCQTPEFKNQLDDLIKGYQKLAEQARRVDHRLQTELNGLQEKKDAIENPEKLQTKLNNITITDNKQKERLKEVVIQFHCQIKDAYDSAIDGLQMKMSRYREVIHETLPKDLARINEVLDEKSAVSFMGGYVRPELFIADSQARSLTQVVISPFSEESQGSEATKPTAASSR